MSDNVPIHTGWSVRQVAGRIGAEVSGVRLAADLPEGSVTAIRRLLHQHKVLFFRNQEHLDDAEQEAFGRALRPDRSRTRRFRRAAAPGDPRARPSRDGGRANSWHTDVTFVDAYPEGVDPARARGAGLGRRHRLGQHRGRLRGPARSCARWPTGSGRCTPTSTTIRRTGRDASEEDLRRYHEVFTRTVYETEHPVVHVHPETGERTLLLGHFVKRSWAVHRRDSARLFQLLQATSRGSRTPCAGAGQAGDVAIWDNRATQHYAINDYGDQQRVVRRVTVDGDAPVEHRRPPQRQPKRPKAVTRPSWSRRRPERGQRIRAMMAGTTRGVDPAARRRTTPRPPDSAAAAKRTAARIFRGYGAVLLFILAWELAVAGRDGRFVRYPAVHPRSRRPRGRAPRRHAAQPHADQPLPSGSGFGIAVAVAISLGLFMGSFRVSRRWSTPCFNCSVRPRRWRSTRSSFSCSGSARSRRSRSSAGPPSFRSC